MGAHAPRRIGLIVNPIAGLGGPTGLHGTDGQRTWRLAEARGGTRQAGFLTDRFLQAVGPAAAEACWLAAPGPMGEDHLARAGIGAVVVPLPKRAHAHVSSVANGSGLPGDTLERDQPDATLRREVTTGDDTTDAASEMAREGIELIVFAGGDGTARDVLAGMTQAVVLLGIPAGVKMQSGVFGHSPAAAASALIRWLGGAGTAPAEIVDLDEDAHRQGIIRSRLYGIADTVAAPAVVCGRKTGSAAPADADLLGIAAEARLRMDADAVWLLGPGRTVQEVAKLWGLSTSLLGVDIVDHGQLVVRDASAADVHRVTQGRRVRVLLSPIGGQGFLLGRGNQQITVGLGGRIRCEDLVVVSSEEKLAGLADGAVFADLGYHLEAGAEPYLRVITGRGRYAVIRVAWDTQIDTRS